MQIDRETIIKLARKAGIVFDDAAASFYERFANLVAEHRDKWWEEQVKVEVHEAVLEEREACAKVCHDASVPLPGELQSDAQWSALCLATSIRARGK